MVISTACAAISGATLAGATDTSRMWRSCVLSIGTNAATEPSTARAATTDNSRSKSMKASRIAS